MTRTGANIPADGARGGFTVLELIVVLWVVALLIGLILGVGPRVLDAQRAVATRNVIHTLDRALDVYLADNNNVPPLYNPFDYEQVPGEFFVAANTTNTNETETHGIVDNNEPHVRHPDAAIFLAQVRGYESIDSILNAVPDRLIVRTNLPENSEFWRPNNASDQFMAPATVLDAWGAIGGSWSPGWPIYEKTYIHYVHPNNELAQRLYGSCVNNRPYFFSAGPDRLYGVTNQMNRSSPGERPPGDPAVPREEYVRRALNALADNIYSYQPDLADRSEGFGDDVR